MNRRSGCRSPARCARWVGGWLLAVGASGCVSEGTYHAAVADGRRAAAEEEQVRAWADRERSVDRRQIEKLEQDLQREAADRVAASTRMHNVSSELEAAAETDRELRRELTTLADASK